MRVAPRRAGVEGFGRAAAGTFAITGDWTGVGLSEAAGGAGTGSGGAEIILRTGSEAEVTSGARSLGRVLHSSMPVRITNNPRPTGIAMGVRHQLGASPGKTSGISAALGQAAGGTG